MLRATNGLTIPYLGYVILDFEVQGVKIPAQGAIIVQNDCLSACSVLLGMNVITACWKELFQMTVPMTVPVSSCSQDDLLSRGVWTQAFVDCQRIATSQTKDGFVSTLLSAGAIKAGCSYEAIVEPIDRSTPIVVARTIGTVKNRRITLRIKNVDSYPVFLGKYWRNMHFKKL